MKYANTAIINGLETVAATYPLALVPGWDPENPLPGTYAVPDEVEKGWARDGGGWVPPPPPTPEELQRQCEAAVQRRLDAFAQTRGYDGILSACTYATSTNPKFRAEGQHAVEARDAAWAAWHGILEAAQAGGREMPTLDGLFAELPALGWPG